MVITAPVISSLSSVPTTGGPITVQGSNFGPLSTDVTLQVNGVNCSNVHYVVPHTSVACDVPEGVGLNQVVFIAIGGQNTSANFAYEGKNHLTSNFMQV